MYDKEVMTKLNLILDRLDLTVTKKGPRPFGGKMSGCPTIIVYWYISINLKHICTVKSRFKGGCLPYHTAIINGKEYYIDDKLYEKVVNYNKDHDENLKVKRKQEEEQKANIVKETRDFLSRFVGGLNRLSYQK